MGVLYNVRVAIVEVTVPSAGTAAQTGGKLSLISRGIMAVFASPRKTFAQIVMIPTKLIG